MELLGGEVGKEKHTKKEWSDRPAGRKKGDDIAFCFCWINEWWSIELKPETEGPEFASAAAAAAAIPAEKWERKFSSILGPSAETDAPIVEVVILQAYFYFYKVAILQTYFL